MAQRAQSRFAGAARVIAPALALALATLSPAQLAAQSGTVQDFDLRPRATPTPAPPPVVGPVDPDNPVPQPRPRAAPRADTPIVLPGESPAPATSTPAPMPTDRAQPRAVAGTAAAPSPRDSARGIANPAAATPAPAVPDAGAAPVPPLPGAYVPRRLDTVKDGGPSLVWGLVAGLALLVAGLGWLAWSRHFRDRARALGAPEIERPRLPATPAPQPSRPLTAAEAPALALSLEATRMSATLVNTTLTYRLAVTNNGTESLRDVVVAGDMIAAHASRPVEELLGPGAVALPEIHRIAGLAPGESVTLGGDIRLPLVAITPIRQGNAALFVPLARLRARGTTGQGAAVEGAGTFLVGQGGNTPSARLQPFRLDLGPRNYSRLGQQLLPATA